MNIDKGLIISRIISMYNLKNKAGLAKFLNVSPGTISAWVSRNSLDYDLVFTKCSDSDFNLLIKGKAFVEKKGNKQAIALVEEPENNIHTKQTEIEALIKALARLQKDYDVLEEKLSHYEDNNTKKAV